MTIGLLILRVVVGALFVGHGTQKLFGWFGGHGMEGTAGFMESIRYRHGRLAALLAGLAETVSGLLLILGFVIPLAAAGIIAVMLNAMATVHFRSGLWNANGGIELPLLYAVTAAALSFTGPGSFSLDRVFGLDLAGNAYGIGALVLGVVGALIGLALRHRRQSGSRPSVSGQQSMPAEAPSMVEVA
jgi:putative oxidoreductase